MNVETLEARETPAAPAGNALLWQPYPSSSAFSLHSNPGANKVLYLDFDGATISGTSWNTSYNNGNPITVPAWSMDANRTAFSTIERDKIILIWRQVAEDFAPFDIDVTTQDPGVAAIVRSGGSDAKYGMRAVICPDLTPYVSGTPTAWTSVLGIANLNSFGSAIDNPCFINDGDLSPTPEFSMADTISHEVGHTLGLSHDGDAVNVYYPGHGVGATSWGPIMGSTFGINLTQWSKGQYAGANNTQDDLAIITSNGFGYRKDDYANTASGGKALNGAVQANLTTTYGLISRDTDSDYFKFYADPGPINIAIDPLFTLPNLDVRADLYGPTGNLIMSLNPATTINAVFALNLTTKGIHYIKVSSGSLAGPTGYTTYGSLGSYKISGTVTPFTPSLSLFKRLNPVRWAYNSRARTYSGYVMVANLTNLTFTGTFTFTFTLPDPSVKVLSGGGVQNGRTYTYTYRGTIAPGRPLKILLVLSNPRRFYLSTSNRSFITNMEFTA